MRLPNTHGKNKGRHRRHGRRQPSAVAGARPRKSGRPRGRRRQGTSPPFLQLPPPHFFISSAFPFLPPRHGWRLDLLLWRPEPRAVELDPCSTSHSRLVPAMADSTSTAAVGTTSWLGRPWLWHVARWCSARPTASTIMGGEEDDLRVRWFHPWSTYTTTSILDISMLDLQDTRLDLFHLRFNSTLIDVVIYI